MSNAVVSRLLQRARAQLPSANSGTNTCDGDDWQRLVSNFKSVDSSFDSNAGEN